MMLCGYIYALSSQVDTVILISFIRKYSAQHVDDACVI